MFFCFTHLQCIKAPIFKHHIPNDFHQSLQEAANKQTCDPNKLQQLSHQLYSERGQEFKGFVSRTSENEGEICVYLIHEEKTVSTSHVVRSVLHITSYIHYFTQLVPVQRDPLPVTLLLCYLLI